MPTWHTSAQLRTIIISDLRHAAIPALILTALLGTQSAYAAASHDYTITVDAELSRLDVTARFGGTINDIAARSRSAARFLIDANDCDSGKAVEIRGRRMLLAGTEIRCLTYSVDLAKIIRAEKRNESLAAHNVIASPTTWMWRPPLDTDDEIAVAFRLPEAVNVSVPWKKIDALDKTYRLTASPQSGSAIAVFGRFDTVVTHVASMDLTITLLQAANETATAAIVEWIRDTAKNIMLAYGRFPNPDASVVVFPVEGKSRRGESAVLFGRVVRDGGESVELLIDASQPIESSYGDWTATHEFAHLMLPYVHREQRWISEGFAQYYQNVLLARAGHYAQQFAWQKLHDGLARGHTSVPDLSPNEAAAGDERSGRMKIYWSGAALALLADIELRGRPDGEESLDVVLDRFQQCCLPSARTWTGIELFTKFDMLIDEPLFMDLYRRYADATGFPDVRPLLAQLGVTLDGDTVRLSDDAELAEIRAAITAQRYTEEPGN